MPETELTSRGDIVAIPLTDLKRGHVIRDECAGWLVVSSTVLNGGRSSFVTGLEVATDDPGGAPIVILKDANGLPRSRVFHVDKTRYVTVEVIRYPLELTVKRMPPSPGVDALEYVPSP